MATRMSCSTTFSQNGSNSGSPNDREPRKPGHRRGTDEHDARAPLHDPLELLDGLLHDRQGDHRRGEDAALVVELPGLVHPLVEGVDHDVDQLGIVAHALLHQAGERGEHQGAVDPLLVHQLEPRGRLPERRDGSHRLAEDLPAALPLGVAVPEVVLLAPGRATTSKVGLGMYSLICPRITIFVRPRTST